MFPESDLLPLSALQHLAFCERQWGLIHLEQQWDENRLTAEGRILHDRVHDAGTEARPGVIVARGLALHCLRLGITGQADAVEFQRSEAANQNCVALAGRKGWWRPFPIEYKRGKPKAGSIDEVQLCAQALCLGEMLSVRLDAGALFYGETRRRQDVPFDAKLRAETEGLCRRMHELYSRGSTPAAVYARKCERCSLMSRCLPKAPSQAGAVAGYFKKAFRELERDP